MATCPRCHVALGSMAHGGVESWVCGVCKGVSLKGESLRQHFGNATESLRKTTGDFNPNRPKLDCPAGCGPMRSHRIGGAPPVDFDVCPMCVSAWFDRGELAAAVRLMRARTAARPAPRGESPYEAARRELTQVELVQETSPDDRGPRDGWHWWLFALASGLPVEGYNPVFRFPLVTWGLVLTCAAVFGAQLVVGPQVLHAYALVPADLTHGGGSNFRGLFTSLFLHADIFHLLGNVYFLKVFGDNVEDRLGRSWFFGLYLCSGLVAGVAQAASDVTSLIPVIGASGAIAGVLGAYAVLFPNARISVLVLFHWFRVRSLWYLPFWFAWNVFFALVLKRPGVAWWAHIGGFLAGVLLAVISKYVLPDRRLRTLAAARVG